MLKLIKVSREFNNGKGKIIALDNFSYHFKNNGFYVVVGPSGSGKTTLLNILASLDQNASGRVLFQKKDILRFNLRKQYKYRNIDIGMIYQSSHLIPYLNVKDNITLSNKLDNELINLLGINRLVRRDITKLSGGQRQRVSLARALSNNPSIILADEPTGALDQNNAQKVMEVLQKESKNKLVIMVSHDLELCHKYCDVILYLDQGRLIKEEKINIIKENNINIKRKGRKKKIIKLALSFLKYKSRRTLLTALCCSIGLITMMLSMILSEGFTNFFTTQFNNSLNSNIIYGYPKTKENSETISLFDVQDLASYYQCKWEIFYLLDEEYKFNVQVNNNVVNWLDYQHFFHYSYNEEINIKDEHSFVLNFPASYWFIFNELFNKNLNNVSQINQYLRENEIIFIFNLNDNVNTYNLKIRLDYIIWNYEDKIEIMHSSKLWIEQLSQYYNFKILSDLDSKGIIRYPYLYEYKNINAILEDSKYQNLNFYFDQDYKGKKIAIGYYPPLSRITKSYLEQYLIYEEIYDYLYLSNNGVSIEHNMPSLTFNNINGRDISFSPLVLDEDEINKSFIFKGNIPRDDLEIIVSKYLLDKFNVKLNSFLEIRHKLNKKIKVKIVGYIEGNNANIIYQKGSWTYNFFINHLKLDISDLPCFQVSLHLKNQNNIPYYVAFLSSSKDIEFISPLYEANKEIEKIMDYFELGIMILSIFSIFISLILISMIIFMNTIEQKKYDAILIMQGYKKRNIILMHMLQNILICLLAYFITLVMSYLIVVEVNSVFSMMMGLSYYSFANLSLSTLAMILICLFILGIVVGYVPLKLLKLNNPLKILKE